MKVVVTGGAGFIGAHTCAELGSRPEIRQVVALDDLSTGLKRNLDDCPADVIVGSILDRDTLDSAVCDADAVVHLAARPSVPRSLVDPIRSHQVNATGTAYVLEACRRSGASLVVASSSSVYGGTPGLPRHEELPARPLSPYAASKLATEAYALSWAAAFDMRVLAVRFFNVYGPLQRADHAYAAVIPAFIHTMLLDRPVIVHGDGRQTRDFTYVGTVAKVLSDAVIRRVTSPDPVNLAFGTRTTILEVARRLAELAGKPVRINHEHPRAGDVRDSQAASDRLLSLFPGVSPVPLDEGLRRTLLWFRAQGEGRGAEEHSERCAVR